MSDISSQSEMAFRKATLNDLDTISDILRRAVQKMLSEGKKQWTEKYPTRVHALADIERGVGHVLELDGKVVAYGAVVFDGESAYLGLEGEWLSNMPYVVVHRIAVDSKIMGKGLGAGFLTEVEKYALSKNIRSFRIDTNYDNFAMLHLLPKLGFTYCGEVTYESGKRKAFEKLL